MRKNEILKVIRENREKIKEFGVKRIGIFGSFARDEAGEESDIDIIVEFDEGKKNFDNFFDNFINLAFFLEELFGKKIDLLTLESLSPYIKPYVEKEVIYERL